MVALPPHPQFFYWYKRTKRTALFSLKCWYYNIVYTYSKTYKAIVFALFGSFDEVRTATEGSACD
ncbi:hypothetical protein [Brachyspira pilosicoli]|uniref:hypothetical protein n=1 Tax=Brachyspira pilosicoli TaxID=52584 RepID=UPI00243271BF|nr:hypothetical protein [Brachyspira pilosicoli]